MKKIFHFSGKNGTILQVEGDGSELAYDFDSVSEDCSEEIDRVLNEYAPGGVCKAGFEWADAPIFSAIDEEELAEYVGD